MESGYFWKVTGQCQAKDPLLPPTLASSSCWKIPLPSGMQVDLARPCLPAMPSTLGRRTQISARHKNSHAMMVCEMPNSYQVRSEKMQQKCSPTLTTSPPSFYCTGSVCVLPLWYMAHQVCLKSLLGPWQRDVPRRAAETLPIVWCVQHFFCFVPERNISPMITWTHCKKIKHCIMRKGAAHLEKIMQKVM